MNNPKPLPQQPTLIRRLRVEKHLWLAIAMLLSFALIATLGAARQSATYDEVTHLPAGYMYLRTGDYRLNPEHPPLLKKIAAWPLLLMNIEGDPTPWMRSEVSTAPPLALRRVLVHWHGAINNGMLQYNFGNSWMYPVRDEKAIQLSTTTALSKADYFNNADRMLFWARLPMVVLGTLLGLLIFVWTYELFGMKGGLLSLAIYCFEPNFLAHAPLVTTDVGVGLFLFGALYFLWRTFRHFDAISLTGLIVCSGLAVASKFSGMLLLPLAVLLGIARIVSRSPWTRGQSRYSIAESWQQRAKVVISILIGVSFTTYVLLWACYGFRYTMVPDPANAAQGQQAFAGEMSGTGHPPLQELLWSSVRRRDRLAAGPAAEEATSVPPRVSITEGPTALGWFGNTLITLQSLHALPEAYLHGLAYMHVFSHGRGTFLRGEHSATGFGDYFLWTTLYKTTLPCLFLLLCTCLVLIVRWRTVDLSMLFLLIPVLVYALITLASHVNIGHRHVLPMLPFAMVLAGQLPRCLGRLTERTQRRLWLGTVALLGLSSQVALPWGQGPDLIFPDYLTYFNEIAGGPRTGHQVLVDSNCDWGQGTKQLAEWVEKEGISKPIGIFNFGMSDPQFAGISYWNLESTYPFMPGVSLEELDKLGANGPEYWAVHATHYQGAYMNAQQRKRLHDRLKRGRFVAAVANSIFIYRFPPNEAEASKIGLGELLKDGI